MKKSRDYLSWALAALAVGFMGLYGLETSNESDLRNAEALAQVVGDGCVAHASGSRGEILLVTCDAVTKISGIPASFEVVVIRARNAQQRCRVADSKPIECVAQSAPDLRAVVPAHSS